MGKLAISEIVLFDESLNKWRATGGVADVFRWWVSTNSESTKQWVDPESTRAQNGILLRWSWPRIKGEVRETKSEWGSERVELDSLLHREVQCSPQSVWSPGGRSLFFWGFLGNSCWSISSCWSTTAFGRDRSLLLQTGVQLVVSCTTIETQIVFEVLFTLVTGQLAIAGQLGREVHLRSIGLLFGSRGWRWLRERVLGR